MNNTTLADVCTIKGGSGFPESLQGIPDGDFPVIKVSDMSLPGNHRIVRYANNYVSKRTALAMGFAIFPCNSVVFAKVGAALLLNRRRMLAQDSILDNNMMGLIPAEGIDQSFLFYFMQSVDLGLLVQTGALPSVNQEIIGEIPLPSFDGSEQRKIARILTTLDNLIEKTEALIAKYQAIKQGMMHDLFTRGVDSSGQLRPTRQQAPDLYKQSELGFGMIPVDWQEGSIQHFCEIHNSLRFPISEEVRANMEGDYRYYGPTGILDYINEYRVEGKFVLIGEDGDHFLKFHRQHMTILAEGQFNVNNHAHILSGKAGCRTDWIHLFFCHRDITGHVSRQGAGRLKLNKAALQAIPMLVPDEKEQRMSFERFTSAESRIANEAALLQKLRKLKSGLMQDLLTGKVRVKVDDTEEVAAHA